MDQGDGCDGTAAKEAVVSHHQVPCRSCGQYVVFLPTKSGKNMPVDVDTVDEADTEFDHKRHVSHFATCNDPARFRKPKP